MAVVFDNSVINQGSGFAFTVANQPNRIILVMTINQTGGSPATAVTYGGQALTRLDSSPYGPTGDFDTWYRIAPLTGSNTVVVTGGGAMNINAYSYYGVAQVEPEAHKFTTGTGNSPSGTITTLTANAVVFASYGEDSTGTRTVTYGGNMGNNRNPANGTNIVGVAGNAQADSGPVSVGNCTSALTMAGGVLNGSWALAQIVLGDASASTTPKLFTLLGTGT